MRLIANLSPALCFTIISLQISAQLTVQHLTCENQENPVGIGEPAPRFGWKLASKKRGCLQTAYEITVRSADKTEWSTGKVSSGQSTYIPYGGDKLQPNKRYTWKVRVWDHAGVRSAWSGPATFQTAFFSPADWKAKWIESGFSEDSVNRPAQYFRTSFTIIKKVRSATVFITAHGMYEARINGKRIGDQYLSPGWTSYNKRLQYQAYDITTSLVTGRNAIGATLGNGWYRGYLAWNGTKNIYGRRLALLLQLEITFTDGSRQIIVSDDSWKCSTGSIAFSEIYHGETIDARLEKEGWSEGGYDDSRWFPVKAADHPYSHLVSMYNEPVRKHERFRPVNIFTTPKGEKVIDFGQNLVGWVEVKARGRSGDKISFQHAEVLDKHGNFYTDNMRAARTTAEYILAGKGEERFEPHFTFFGFRYIRVTEYPGEISPENFEAVALYSDMRPTGTFACSDSLINQLQHNIQWGQRGNFLDVPTDCPQRDERLGWTGDAQVFSPTAAFNFDVHRFFSKWLKDLAADQQGDGRVPYVIPNVLGPMEGGSAGWADAATIIPWNMYRLYGDKKILEEQYNSMKSWVGFMEKHSAGDLWNTGFHFGDWLFYRPFDDNDGRSAVTDKYLIAQCFYAHSTELVIRSAEVLGKPGEAETYRNLLRRIRLAFQKEYLTAAGRLVSGTQTAYVLALQFGMIPDSLRQQAADRLVQNVRAYGNHLTTGFLGTPYLCEVLSNYGHADVAYQLLMQKTYPSWLYPVTKGATTIWERWNGIHPDGNFETATMNSFNHYAYGAIGDWMYRTIAGINMDESEPAYKAILIKPVPGGGISSATGSLETRYGRLSSSWQIQGTQFILEVEIPANTTATIFIPSAEESGIKESEMALGTNDEIKDLGRKGDKRIVRVGSGRYRFVVSRP